MLKGFFLSLGILALGVLAVWWHQRPKYSCGDLGTLIREPNIQTYLTNWVDKNISNVNLDGRLERASGPGFYAVAVDLDWKLAGLDPKFGAI